MEVSTYYRDTELGESTALTCNLELKDEEFGIFISIGYPCSASLEEWVKFQTSLLTGKEGLLCLEEVTIRSNEKYIFFEMDTDCELHERKHGIMLSRAKYSQSLSDCLLKIIRKIKKKR